MLYRRLRDAPQADAVPRTFLFGGKAAPAYGFAKLVIKFINNLAATIDRDPAMRAGSKWYSCPITTSRLPNG
jgi:glycogen phosphorylase